MNKPPRQSGVALGDGPTSGTAETAAPIDGEARPRLANFWHPIAASEDVTEQPKRFVLLDEELAVFRDGGGLVRAFKDVCIHRGAALSMGTVNNGYLTCAYHGWQYDKTGACVHIPSLVEGQAVPSKARAIVYRAKESAGLVWVCLDDPAAALPSPPGDVWSDPDFRVIISHREHWVASASRAIENYMDFSHFPFVHAGLLGDPNNAVIGTTVTGPVEDWERGLKYWYAADEPPESPYPGRKRFVYYLETPFTAHLERSLGDGQTMMLTLVASPTREMETEVFVIHARNCQFDEPDETFRKFAEEVMLQDRPVVESQRPHKIPLQLREEMHIKIPDAHAVAYRRALAGIDDTFAFMP